jgi:hypothetical protein
VTQSSQNGVWHFAKLNVHGRIRWDEGTEQGFPTPDLARKATFARPLVFYSLQKESYQTFTHSISAKSYCLLCAAIRVTRPEQRTSLSRSSVQSSCQTCLWALQKHAADTSDQAGALNNRLASTTAAIGRRKRQPPGMLNNHRPVVAARYPVSGVFHVSWYGSVGVSLDSTSSGIPSITRSYRHTGMLQSQGFLRHLTTLEMLLGVC